MEAPLQASKVSSGLRSLNVSLPTYSLSFLILVLSRSTLYPDSLLRCRWSRHNGSISHAIPTRDDSPSRGTEESPGRD